jgi:ABC-type lipoprotein release transport system permease subunit
MTLTRLCLRDLLYHWRGNLAVLLGVVVGSTVLTGALLVGDSLRGSLRELSLERLGWVDEALVAPRFFRQALAEGLQQDGAAERVCPVLLLQATAAGPGGRARGVTVLGVDARFWGPAAGETFADARQRPVAWVNATLAADLGITPGARLKLALQKPSAVPRESLLGRRGDRDVVDEWELPVDRVLDVGEFGDRFSLRPDIRAARNVFVPLRALQRQLGLRGRVNALLAAGATPQLPQRLRARLDLDDWGLVLRGPADRVNDLFRKLDVNHDGALEPREWRDRLAESLVRAIDPGAGPTLTEAAVRNFYERRRAYLTLESPNLLIDPYLAGRALEAARHTGLRAAPTLVYLANTIAAGGKEIPYSVVAALDPGLSPPLGPFLPPGATSLADDQIVLADWKDSPLPRRVGEDVRLSYFPPEHQGDLRERSATFRLAGFVALEGMAADSDLTPEFPGITDKLTIDQWNPPFPYHNERIKARDERYWKEYRTTPKAYVTLRTGQELWGNRFGDVTSIRLAPDRPQGSLAEVAEEYRRKLLQQFDPAGGGFTFEPVKAQALAAAGGGTDFGTLFLGFSFFLIAAALMLVGLLFRLNLQRRAAEVGLLAAVGYRKRTLSWLLLGEGALVALVGSVTGCLVALLYAGVLLRLLEALWPGGGLQSFLRPHAAILSLATGAGASLLVSVLTIAWGLRVLARVPPRALLAGRAESELGPGIGRPSRWPWILAATGLAAAVALAVLGRFVHDDETRAMTFFAGGGLLLTACLSALAGWMRGSRHRTVEGHGGWTLARLGIRNASRHPTRSLLTAGLLAAAAFLIVAVEAFRRSANSVGSAATGGFGLVAEADLPLYVDLNTADGRQQVLDKLLPVFRDELGGDNKAAEARVRTAGELLAQVRVASFRVEAGDDVSCLNLYKPTRPRLLGVPDSIVNRGGFEFADTAAASDAERANPWLMLRRDGTDVPAFGEKNTVQWVLKSDLGGQVVLAQPPPLRIDGLLQDSVFQSSLLVSEGHFLRLFPGHEGYNYFLIRCPPGREAEVKRLLDTALADRGFEATPVTERLAAYLAVENTYLSTFQALGGLGLVLGSLGLAVVLLRGVWERRGELALLRAVGYRRRAVGWLVLAENAFLLAVGLIAGTVSALVAVAPHVGGAGVPWGDLLVMLAAVLVVGLSCGAVATASVMRAPLIPALRQE